MMHSLTEISYGKLKDIVSEWTAYDDYNQNDRLMCMLEMHRRHLISIERLLKATELSNIPAVDLHNEIVRRQKEAGTGDIFEKE